MGSEREAMDDYTIFQAPTAAEDETPLARPATAIATMYEGIVYRSRLEARWQLFFQTLGIIALYEHEAYELSEGTKYLPDFWSQQVATPVAEASARS